LLAFGVVGCGEVFSDLPTPGTTTVPMYLEPYQVLAPDVNQVVFHAAVPEGAILTLHDVDASIVLAWQGPGNCDEESGEVFKDGYALHCFTVDTKAAPEPGKYAVTLQFFVETELVDASGELLVVSANAE